MVRGRGLRVVVRGNPFPTADIERNCGMLFGGVSVEDRLVRELAGILNRPLGSKLGQALLFRAKIVALTREEKAVILAALERAGGELEQVRGLLLADERWREGRRRLE
jgi:hypothetical protein